MGVRQMRNNFNRRLQVLLSLGQIAAILVDKASHHMRFMERRIELHYLEILIKCSDTVSSIKKIARLLKQLLRALIGDNMLFSSNRLRIATLCWRTTKKTQQRFQHKQRNLKG